MFKGIVAVAVVGFAMSMAVEAGASPARQAGSEIVCSLTIHPFVTSHRTGERIYLNPSRFVVETDSPEVIVVPENDAWKLHSETVVATKVRYRVVDQVLEQVVVEDEAALFCGAGAPVAPAEQGQAPEPEEAPAPEPDEPSDPELPRRVGVGFLFGFGSAAVIAAATAYPLLDDFEVAAAVSTACMLSGAALFVGGFALLYPKAFRIPQVAVVPSFGPDGGGIQLVGTF